MLLPIIGWLALAQKDRPLATRLIGAAFTLTFGVAWIQAEQWRTSYTRAESAPKAYAYHDIKDVRLPIADVLDRNAARYWSNTPSARDMMRQRLPTLRSEYQRKWPQQPTSAELGHRRHQ